ncbi:MAG: enoyl-CoA hydratase/isomerase family protein [Betaproteobacteria bacterium AqS2]|uniref:Enoyl-CoA hydratase/isomerase family protein n=1 Tax=Candidatus Amphirhobacter heronislandensis TaxID=1732024 RepID=A0A930Y0Z9_9GAMM|nr:enoyl-CoA hydratase/isomerase family protein [Betaproteobacteria bacterium AqS2]
MGEEKAAAGSVRAAFEDGGKIAVITVANERRANAIDAAMIDELAAAIDESSRARAVILTGAGERHFSSGGDIASWGAMEPAAYGRDWIEHGAKVFAQLGELPGFVIAAVNGTCFGGGLELALHADARIAAEHARFRLPETSLGMIPGWRGGPLLAEAAGQQAALRMALAGEELDADAALRAGVVSEVLPAAGLLARARELAAAAAARSPVANALAKRLLRGRLDVKAHGELGAEARASADCAEGLAAFKDKRAPNFTDD